MGNFLVAASDESKVFVLDGRASKSFEPLGYVSEYKFQMTDVQSQEMRQIQDNSNRLIIQFRHNVKICGFHDSPEMGQIYQS